MKDKILIIVGPTASGKSALAVRLARKFKGEVISADSRQVYKGLDIGTGKITKKEMKGVAHHLLDVASPSRKFSAADFVHHARIAHSQVLKKPRVSILVGGTGYYIDAFVGRIAVPDAKPNLKLRKALEKKNAAQLYSLLRKKDPVRARAMASQSERNNKRRLIRALEIVAQMGSVPMWDLRSPTYDLLWIGIAPPFDELEKKISRRLDHRVRNGMVAEARKLHKTGLSFRRMEELGLEYRSLSRLLQRKISQKEMVAELNRDIRRYAKKQIAYWKRNSEIKWFKPTDAAKIEKQVRGWLLK